MVILERILRNENLIGHGAESLVYRFDSDKVFKYLINPTKNKINKITALSMLNIPNFVFPEELVYNEKGQPIGYIMDQVSVDASKSIDNKAMQLQTIADKIELFKKQENLLKAAHNNDLIMVDFNYRNFLIDQLQNVVAIDTDNYFYKEFPNDINPALYYDYYIDKVSEKITPDLDKMSFTLNALYLLTGGIFSRNAMQYYSDDEYIEDIINELAIPKSARELLLELVSDSTNKPYINNDLDCLKSEQKYIKKKTY